MAIHKLAYKIALSGKSIVLSIVILAIAQTASYYAMAEGKMASTTERHLAKEHKTLWVCVPQECLANLEGYQRACLLKFLRSKFRTVYEKMEAIPPSIQSGEDHSTASTNQMTFGKKYEDGIIFTWSDLEKGLFWFKATTSNYRGSAAASSRRELFVWFFGKWIKAKTEYNCVS